MSDTHERPTLPRKAEQDHPYAGLEQFWDFEVERRRSRKRGYTELGVGLSGLVGLILLAAAGAGFVGGIGTLFTLATLAVVSGVACGVSSLWMTFDGLRGLGASRQLPPPRSRRAVRGGGQQGNKSDEPAERQLLEVMERNGEITPARAALQTSLTVDEAERLLSELAQRGHLDVRVEGSKLVYSL